MCIYTQFANDICAEETLTILLVQNYLSRGDVTAGATEGSEDAVGGTQRCGAGEMLYNFV